MVARRAPTAERLEAGSLDRELQRLLVGTNDLRRRTGQALWHLDRTLVFWGKRGRPFLEAVRLWLPAGASVFESTARTLRECGEPAVDRRLRRFVATVVGHLADELDRGDQRLHPFLRWLEGRFPLLTEMMKAERPDSRVCDSDLARSLSEAFALASRGDRRGVTSRLRKAAAAMV